MSPSSDPGTASSDPGTASTPRHEVAVVLPADLHARPAGLLARTAAGFISTLHIDHAGRTATPASVLSVMALGATAGSTVTVRAEGPDAQAAAAALAGVLAAAQ